MSLASSPEKDFLLSVIMGINDSPRKQCVLLIPSFLECPNQGSKKVKSSKRFLKQVSVP